MNHSAKQVPAEIIRSHDMCRRRRQESGSCISQVGIVGGPEHADDKCEHHKTQQYAACDEEYLLEANYSDGILVISGYEYRVAAEILYVLPRLVQDIIEKQPTGEFVFNTDNLATVSPQN